jgi:autotransporter-associated beta strand protein
MAVTPHALPHPVPKCRRTVWLQLIAAFLMAGFARGATLTWDIVTGNGASITDGSGTWSTFFIGFNTWNNGAGNQNWSNAIPDSAIFGAGGPAGTVTLGALAPDVANITFNAVSSGTYNITGSATLDTSASVITTNANGIISAPIAGTTITKTGAATLTLSNGNTFIGTLTVQAGTLSVPIINNQSTVGPLGSSGFAVVLGSSGQTATLQYTGGGTPVSNKTFSLASGGTGVFQVDTAGTISRSRSPTPSLDRETWGRRGPELSRLRRATTIPVPPL